MILYRFRKDNLQRMLSKRLVFMAPTDKPVEPDFSVEDKNAKAEKIMKSPDSFNADTDFKAAKAKLDEVAKKADGGQDNPKYKEALAKLEANKLAYQETQAFARDKIKFWPTLKKYVDPGSVSGKVSAYGEFKSALKMLDALNSHWGPMAGGDNDFRDSQNTIKNNLEESINTAMQNALDLYNESITNILKASTFDSKMTESITLMKGLEGNLLTMVADGFSGYKGDKNNALKSAVTKVTDINNASVKYAELNLKAAQDTLKGLKDDGSHDTRVKIEETKAWEAGAKATVEMQKARQKAVNSLLKAGDVGGNGEGLKKARQLFAEADKIGRTNVVEASKLYAQAEKALEAVSSDVVGESKKKALDVWNKIPDGTLTTLSDTSFKLKDVLLKSNFQTLWNEAEALAKTNPDQAISKYNAVATGYTNALNSFNKSSSLLEAWSKSSLGAEQSNLWRDNWKRGNSSLSGLYTDEANRYFEAAAAVLKKNGVIMDKPNS